MPSKRANACAYRIIEDGDGLRINLSMKLYPKVENGGLRFVFCDREFNLEHDLKIHGITMTPKMKLQVIAEVPEGSRTRYRRNRSLSLAREGSPVLV